MKKKLLQAAELIVPPQDKHPSLWNISWERLPKGDPRRTTCVQVYDKCCSGLVAARKWATGFWETFEHDHCRRLITYENSLGEKVRQYWDTSPCPYPKEIHSARHRWIRLHAVKDRAIYWCALSGWYKDDKAIFSRDDLWQYFNDWSDPAEESVAYAKMLAMPESHLGRMGWCIRNPKPT